VLDLTYDSKRNHEPPRKIIMIEAYQPYGVMVRIYYSSKVQPEIFEHYGGPDSPELFYTETVCFDNLYQGDLLIEYPKNQAEKNVIDILFPSRR